MHFRLGIGCFFRKGRFEQRCGATAAPRRKINNGTNHKMSCHNLPICAPSHAQPHPFYDDMFTKVYQQNLVLVDLLICEKCQKQGWVICQSPSCTNESESTLKENYQEKEEQIEEKEKEHKDTGASGVSKRKCPVVKRSEGWCNVIKGQKVTKKKEGDYGRYKNKCDILRYDSDEEEKEEKETEHAGESEEQKKGKEKDYHADTMSIESSQSAMQDASSQCGIDVPMEGSNHRVVVTESHVQGNQKAARKWNQLEETLQNLKKANEAKDMKIHCD